MDIDKFADEMLISQQNKELTEYVAENWEEALCYMENQRGDMDTLIDLALAVVEDTTSKNVDKYNLFVENLKEHK